MSTTPIVLKKETFNKYTIKPIVSTLDRDYAARISQKTGYSVNVVKNVAAGITFNVKVIKAMLQEYGKKQKFLSNPVSVK